MTPMLDSIIVYLDEYKQEWLSVEEKELEILTHENRPLRFYLKGEEKFEFMKTKYLLRLENEFRIAEMFSGKCYSL